MAGIRGALLAGDRRSASMRLYKNERGADRLSGRRHLQEKEGIQKSTIGVNTATGIAKATAVPHSYRHNRLEGSNLWETTSQAARGGKCQIKQKDIGNLHIYSWMRCSAAANRIPICRN